MVYNRSIGPAALIALGVTLVAPAAYAGDAACPDGENAYTFVGMFEVCLSQDGYGILAAMDWDLVPAEPSQAQGID